MYNSFILFYHNVYPLHVQFNYFPLVFLKKILVCTVSFFCKFRYLDQFYSLTFVILLYNFLPQCSTVTRNFFLSFFLCISYRNKFSLMRTPIWVETFENMKPWVTFFLDPKANQEHQQYRTLLKLKGRYKS